MKAYSLERMTIQAGAREGTEAAAGEGTPPNGTPTEAEADLSDEKSEGHDATPSVDSRHRNDRSTESVDNNPHADG